MPPSESSNAQAAWPQLILVIMLAAGAVLLAPIQSERPTPGGQGIRSGALQDVDLRLWQDPFGTVAKAAQGGKSTDCVAILNAGSAGQLQARPCPQKGAEGISVLGEQIAQRRQQVAVKVLLTLVDGGTSVLADEKRRRTRFAVLAGLNAQGYAPVDAEHIGYTVEKNVYGVDVSMAYEWLLDDSGKNAVLQIWLDEQSLGQEVLSTSGKKHPCPSGKEQQKDGPGIKVCPMSRLALILENLRNLPKKGSQVGNVQQALSFAVIGPSSSSFLKAAAQDAGLAEAMKILDACKVLWYSPFATLPETELKNLRGEPLKLPNIHRVITSDEELVKALVAELKTRRFGSGKAIALVGQWDTAYSRALRDSLNEHISMQAAVEVVEASYLRGLDGRLPGKEVSDKEKSDKDRKKSDVAERPEGEAQIDYLRRLAVQLKAREKEIGRIGAIGVLGNDYYDKLLVLQALRPAFPDAVFFTTDLDAAMLHEKDNPYMRNLIVASGYGLSLNPVIQKDIPPFRDSYQSAAYLAVQLALVKDVHQQNIDASIKPWLTPQLFEIGRSEAVPLTPVSSSSSSAQCNSLLDCSYPHVAASTDHKLFPFLPFAGLGIAWIIGIVSGLARHQQMRYWLGAMVTALVVGLVVNHDAGVEPLDWMQGVSIWPSEYLRSTALVLALAFLIRGIGHLRKTRTQLDRVFFNRIAAWRLESTGQNSDKKTLKTLSSALINELRGCLDTLRRIPGRCFGSRLPKGRVEWSAEGIWDMYNRRCSDANTPSFLCLPFWFNGGVFIASMLLLAYVLQCLGLSLPLAPARGETAFLSDPWFILPAVLAFQSLLFLAAYESFRAIWLTRSLMGRRRWPNAVVSAYWPVAAGQPDHCYLDAWLGVRFIAAVTEPVQRIIFYPFPVLVLLIFARSSLFDRWDIPLMLWVIFLTSILLIVLAALRLRYFAEELRRRSVKILGDQYLQAKACDQKELADQIAAMLSQIKELKTGAFASLSHQPLVKAVLTIAGSVSGIALLEYASLANV